MIDTVIFDMDGVISDTQKLHAQVASEILTRSGAPISAEDITQRFAGIKTENCFRTVLGENGISTDISPLLTENWDIMISLADDGVDPIPGAIELISDLAEHNFKLGVASSSPSEYVETVLSNLGVIDFFGTIVSGLDVKKGKPEPDIFLLAAKNLSSKPEECVVIEDGVSGMIGAKRAGMACIALLETPNGSPADFTIRSLTELTIEKIKSL